MAGSKVVRIRRIAAGEESRVLAKLNSCWNLDNLSLEQKEWLAKFISAWTARHVTEERERCRKWFRMFAECVEDIDHALSEGEQP